MKRTGEPGRLLAFAVRLLGLALAVGVGVVGPSIALASPQIDVDISPRTIALGERARYELTVSDADGAEVTFPNFGELVVVSGPNQTVQSVMHFSRGQQTIRTSRVYSWMLEAPREGTFLIGPATLVHGSTKLASRSLELNCEGQAQPRSQRQQRSRNPLANLPDPFVDDPFGTALFGDVSPPRGESDIFLRASVDKTEVYLGEQVTLSLYLYSQADISGVQALSFPKLDGFWAEDIEAPTQLYPEMKTVRGRPYRAYMLRKRALFPLRAGELTVDPVEAQVNLALSLFFGAQAETVKRRSRPVTLTVKPLPADGQPSGFEASSVGAFRLKATPSAQRVELGQPVQLQLSIEGTGNVKSLRVPRLSLPPGLKTYDPTVSDKTRIAGNRYGGTKTVEWVVVPERTGRFELPALTLPYFDPSRGQYEIARTEPIPIEVSAPAAGLPRVAPDPGEAREPAVANVLATGLRPIRVDASLVSRELRPVWARGWFWPITAAPVLAWALWGVGSIAMGTWRRRDPDKLREKRARGDAGRRLKHAQSLLEAGDSAGLHAEIARALLRFIDDRCGVAAQGLTRVELEQRLVAKGYASGPVRALVRILERCDAARFSPVAADAARMTELVEETRRVIDSLDGAAAGRRRA